MTPEQLLELANFAFTRGLPWIYVDHGAIIDPSMVVVPPKGFTALEHCERILAELKARYEPRDQSRS